MFDFDNFPNVSSDLLGNTAILELTEQHIDPGIDYEIDPEACELIFRNIEGFNKVAEKWHKDKYQTLPDLKISIRYYNPFHYFDNFITCVQKSFKCEPFKFWVNFRVDEFCYYIQHILPAIKHMFDMPLIGFPLTHIHDSHIYYPERICGVMSMPHMFYFTRNFQNFRFMSAVNADDLMMILDIAEKTYGPDVRLTPVFARLLLGSFIHFYKKAGGLFTDDDATRFTFLVKEKCFEPSLEYSSVYAASICGNYSVKKIKELIKAIDHV